MTAGQNKGVKFFNEETASYHARFYGDPRWQAYRTYASDLVTSHFRPSSVLDLGCGPAPSLPKLIDQVGEYICVDGSIQNLITLKNEQGRLGVLVDLESGLALPVRHSFELVILFGLLQYLTDPADTIAQSLLVLKRGGFILVHTPSDYWTNKMGTVHGRGFSYEDMVCLFSGLEIVSLQRLNHVRIERRVNWILGHVKLSVKSKALLWYQVMRMESLLDRSGVRGTDWLLLARRV